MSKTTLLAVHAYPGIEETIRRHWPYWKFADAGGIVAIERREKFNVWPEEVPQIPIGANSYVQGDNLPRRLIDTFQAILERPEFNRFTDICVIEYDSIFLKPLGYHPGGLVTHLACRNSPGFKGNQCFHPYWWANRKMAQWIVRKGRRMVYEGDIEQGFPDRFLGWMFERFGHPYNQGRIFSHNSIDNPLKIQQAREAIKAGVGYVHGIKTAEQLAAILL